MKVAVEKELPDFALVEDGCPPSLRDTARACLAHDAAARPQFSELAERLVAAIRSVLQRAIEDGGTSLRDHVQPGGEIGYFVQRLSVYGREGEACYECGSVIKAVTQSGRSSFYCPTCQR